VTIGIKPGVGGHDVKKLGGRWSSGDLHLYQFSSHHGIDDRTFVPSRPTPRWVWVTIGIKPGVGGHDVKKLGGRWSNGDLHLYQVSSHHGIDDRTFVPSRPTPRYKCDGLTFIPGGATTSINVRHFVIGGLEKVPTRFCEGTFIPNGDSDLGQKY
jgi:hypothetical protein